MVAAVLATVIGAPIAGFVGDMNMPQGYDNHRIRVPFSISGYLIGSQEAGRMPLPSKADRPEEAQLAAWVKQASLLPGRRI